MFVVVECRTAVIESAERGRVQRQGAKSKKVERACKGGGMGGREEERGGAVIRGETGDTRRRREAPRQRGTARVLTGGRPKKCAVLFFSYSSKGTTWGH